MVAPTKMAQIQRASLDFPRRVPLNDKLLNTEFESPEVGTFRVS